MQLLRSQDESPFSSSRRHSNSSALGYVASQDALTPDTVLSMNWKEIWSQSLKDPHKLCEVLLDAIKVPLSVLRGEMSGTNTQPVLFIHPALVHRESCSSTKRSPSISNIDGSINISSSPSLNIDFNEISDSDNSSDESDNSSDEDSDIGKDGTSSSSSSSQRRRRWNHKPEVFELACKLLYKCEPELLPYFVRYVSRGAESAHLFVRGVPVGPTYFPSRALHAIPFMDSGMQQVQVESGKVDRKKIEAIANVMFMADRRLSGVLLVLRADLWDLALDLIRRVQEDGAVEDSSELFTAALYDCMDKRRPERLEQLWGCIPESMTPLDIVHTMSVFVSQQENEGEPEDATRRPPILVNPDQHLTVGMFQGPLIKLIEMRK